MAVKWTPDLSVGVKHIDDQHKIMIDFLDEYTKQHFRDEEAYMEKIGYPEIEAQRKAHASFIENLTKLKSEYNESGGNILVIINANNMVVDWLSNHIRKMDKKIGEYAKTLGEIEK